MADRRELRRNESLAVWQQSLRAVFGESVTVEQLRESELRFDRWWTSISRRALARRAPG